MVSPGADEVERDAAGSVAANCACASGEWRATASAMLWRITATSITRKAITVIVFISVDGYGEGRAIFEKL